MNEQVQPLLQQIIDQTDIETADIPKIDLYMDQVITLFDNTLASSKRLPDDKLLTKTMINNYTKDKILMPATNKKYTPEHIVHMALIYHLKQSLSIGDIKNLFQETLHQDDVNVWTVYQDFLTWKKDQAEQLEQQIEEQLTNQQSQLNEQEQTLLTILSLTHHANMYKRLAEKLIDQMKS